jgi:hypothetical protein
MKILNYMLYANINLYSIFKTYGLKINEIEDLPTTTNYHFKAFTLAQLKQGLKERKNNKIPGTHNFNTELFKYSSLNFKEKLLVFLTEIYMTKILHKTGKKPL